MQYAKKFHYMHTKIIQYQNLYHGAHDENYVHKYKKSS